MATYDIALPSNVRAQFPDRCVSCELPHPSSTAELAVTGSSGGPGVGEQIVDAAIGTPNRITSNFVVRVTVPSCPKCAGPLRRRHGWMTFWLYVGALGGVAIGCAFLMMTKSVWIMLAFVLAGVLIPVIYNLKNPPAFTFTPMGQMICYEFRSELCAKEFAEKNGIDLTPAPAAPSAEGTGSP